MDKEYLQLAANAVMAKLPDNHGFILLTMHFGGGPDNRVQYVSNISREDAVKTLKEFLFRIGAAEDWMKHIQ